MHNYQCKCIYITEINLLLLYPINLFTALFTCLSILLTMSIYSTLCIAIYLELKHINDELMAAGHNGHLIHSDVLSGYVNRYGELIDNLLHRTNQCIGIWAFALIICNIPITIRLLLPADQCHYFRSMFAFIWMAQLLIILSIGAMIHNEVCS